MTDDLVDQALAELQDLVRCRCHPAYTGRGLHDPDCECDSAEAVTIVADLIKAQAAEIERLRDALAKALKLLEAWIEVSEHCNIQEGVCCCGENMEGHSNEHFPLDHGAYIAGRLEVETRTTLAGLKGAKDDD